jgi:hypothetical protein
MDNVRGLRSSRRGELLLPSASFGHLVGGSFIWGTLVPSSSPKTAPTHMPCFVKDLLDTLLPPIVSQPTTPFIQKLAVWKHKVKLEAKHGQMS